MSEREGETEGWEERMSEREGGSILILTDRLKGSLMSTCQIWCIILNHSHY